MNFTNRKALAKSLGIPHRILTYLLYSVGIENSYLEFEIDKKTGGKRTICSPDERLNGIQKTLALNLYSKQKEIHRKLNINPKISHGFEKGKSIITNAKAHIKKRYVFNVDLEDFFESFHFGRVRGYFHRNEHFKLPIEMATIIAQLVCYKGSLPQGAATSPIITNLICQVLDYRILSIAKKYHLDYTRYADDLTFSTNNKYFLDQQEQFLSDLTSVITRAGFKINHKKTRLQYNNSRQLVTGLVVNEKVNSNSDYFKYTKAMAHTLYIHGAFWINDEPGSIRQLEGRFSFINEIDKYDNIHCSLKKRTFRTLNKREREYQKFLFYKYFVGNETPLIITEGKTDILYIKAALKHYHILYPKLIQLESDGTFTYKVSFLKRSKRMHYLFNVVGDGADTINNIYSYYTGAEIHGFKTPNYGELFNRYGCKWKVPVIVIYDNEMKNKGKPLANFKGYTSLQKNEKAQFEKDLKLKLPNTSNLYLLTNPIENGKDEAEIEDLFNQALLNIEINGKKFNRDVEDSSKYFGKHIFSCYVYKNYLDIEFSGFKKILDNLNEIVCGH